MSPREGKQLVQCYSGSNKTGNNNYNKNNTATMIIEPLLYAKNWA